MYNIIILLLFCNRNILYYRNIYFLQQKTWQQYNNTKYQFAGFVRKLNREKLLFTEKDTKRIAKKI